MGNLTKTLEGYFFFSSIRRHTRSYGDWSSEVCSSDLLCLVSFALATFGPWFNLLLGYGLMILSMAVAVVGVWWADRSAHEARRNRAMTNGIYAASRSEERRVGKESR